MTGCHLVLLYHTNVDKEMGQNPKVFSEGYMLKLNENPRLNDRMKESGILKEHGGSFTARAGTKKFLPGIWLIKESTTFFL